MKTNIFTFTFVLAAIMASSPKLSAKVNTLKTAPSQISHGGSSVDGGGGLTDSKGTLLEVSQVRSGIYPIPFDPKKYKARTSGFSPYEWFKSEVFNKELEAYPSLVMLLEEGFAKQWYYVEKGFTQEQLQDLKKQEKSLAVIFDKEHIKVVGYQTPTAITVLKPWLDAKANSVDESEHLEAAGFITHELLINLALKARVNQSVARDINIVMLSRHFGGDFPQSHFSNLLNKVGFCRMGLDKSNQMLALLAKTLEQQTLVRLKKFSNAGKNEAYIFTNGGFASGEIYYRTGVYSYLFDINSPLSFLKNNKVYSDFSQVYVSVKPDVTQVFDSRFVNFYQEAVSVLNNIKSDPKSMGHDSSDWYVFKAESESLSQAIIDLSSLVNRIKVEVDLVPSRCEYQW